MSWASHPQAGPDGGLRHLLTLDGLPRRHLEHLLRWAARYLAYLAGDRLAAPPGRDDLGRGLLAGACVAVMFLDADEQAACVAAASALGAEIRFCPDIGSEVTSLPLGSSAGEAPIAADGSHPRRLIDRLPAVADARYLVLQHRQNGAPFLLAAHCATHQQILNAGDGSYAHPIRALCNVLAILQRKPAITALRVAILGDIADSGVARSTLHALTTLGTPEIRVVGPTALSFVDIAQLGATWYEDREIGLADIDAVIVLPADGPDAGDTHVRASTQPDLLVQAVWMAVFAVLAGCSDENVHRVIGWQGTPHGKGDLPDVESIQPRSGR